MIGFVVLRLVGHSGEKSQSNEEKLLTGKGNADTKLETLDGSNNT